MDKTAKPNGAITASGNKKQEESYDADENLKSEAKSSKFYLVLPFFVHIQLKLFRSFFYGAMKTETLLN